MITDFSDMHACIYGFSTVKFPIVSFTVIIRIVVADEFVLVNWIIITITLF